MKVLFVLALAFHTSYGLLFGSDVEWNGLKAGFGINPFSSTTFASLPRTVDEAVKWGWTRDASAGACGISGTKFNGNRFVKDNDPGAMILFDKNGYIAGIQAGIPKTFSPSYPDPQNRKYHVFNEETNMWVVTAYFVEPASICTTGRTKEQFEKQGTGNMLAFQTGNSADKLMRIPMDQSKVLAQTNFVEGKCFYMMGMHYWYDISKDMSCDDTFPAFLLYNGGRLTGFGWAFNPDFGKSSYRWEHPDQSVFGSFMKEPPTCLGKDAPVSTLHIYMTDSPRTNFC